MMSNQPCRRQLVSTLIIQPTAGTREHTVALTTFWCQWLVLCIQRYWGAVLSLPSTTVVLIFLHGSSWRTAVPCESQAKGWLIAMTLLWIHPTVRCQHFSSPVPYRSRMVSGWGAVQRVGVNIFPSCELLHPEIRTDSGFWTESNGNWVDTT